MACKENIRAEDDVDTVGTGIGNGAVVALEDFWINASA
jgi:hypothetical protein